MRCLGDNEFKDLVKEALGKLGTQVTIGDRTCGPNPERKLDDDLFYNSQRKRGKNDLTVVVSNAEGKRPAELKSPCEICGVCRYSRAHVASYLLQTIYGQCLNYADLLRPEGSEDLVSYLFVPKVVSGPKNKIGDIEDIFGCVLDTGAVPPAIVMRVSATFGKPAFAKDGVSPRYGVLNTSEGDVLCTRIEYSLIEGRTGEESA